MRAYRLSLFTIASLAASAGPAYAGAWTQPQGDAEIIFTSAYYDASRFFDNGSHTQSQPTYHKYELAPYVEYGLCDDITLGGDFSLQRAAQEGPSGFSSQTNWGLGDSEVFLRKRFWQQDGFVASMEPLIKLPSPSASASDQPRLGDPHFDAAMGLSGGYGFSAYGLNHFVDLDTQYRYRFGPQKNQVKLDATAGIGLTAKWMVMPQAFFTFRTASPTVATFTDSSADDYNLVRVQLSAVYEITEGTSFQFGGFSDVDGKNAGRGNGVLIALWKHL